MSMVGMVAMVLARPEALRLACGQEPDAEGAGVALAASAAKCGQLTAIGIPGRYLSPISNEGRLGHSCCCPRDLKAA